MANSDEGDIGSKNEELQFKKEDLALKKSELEFKRKETTSFHSIEKWKTWSNVGSVAVAAVALWIPLWIAATNIEKERILSEEQAKLTFQMKVADLAMTNANNAKEAQQRAQALAALFQPSQLLPAGFADDFDPEQFKLVVGGSIEKRQQLVALLAQYPGQRKQILKDWYVWFWWDQWWVEPLLEVDDEEKKQLDELSKSLRDNEEILNK